jgi:hypothetical protein
MKKRDWKRRCKVLAWKMDQLAAKHENELRLCWGAVGPGVNGYLPDVIRALREERDRLREMVGGAMTNPIRAAIIRAISQIARQACRNGESGNRVWPPLAQLQAFDSWTCVGEKYADDVCEALLAASVAEMVSK